MTKPLVLIVSPALADANNGNWQTAWRWSRLLAGHYQTRIVQDWQASQGEEAVALLALHARRSAASIQAWAQAHPGRGLGVVLTGTDLYRDIQTDAAAQRSLALAQRLVVLQAQGPQALPVAYRDKTRVIFQSTSARRAWLKSDRHLRAVMVGHLREEKSPETLFAAARLLRNRPDIHIDHIGAALAPTLGELARQTAADCPNYRWLGGLDHETTRRRIQRAHVLVHASRMEGGAHAILEAVCSGTPVLASRIDGNVGMLGDAHHGYFELGDDARLAELIVRARDEANFLPVLRADGVGRGALFAPAAERLHLQQLISSALAAH